MSIFKDHVYLLTPYFNPSWQKLLKTYREGGSVLILVTPPNVVWNLAREWSALPLELTVKTDEKQ